ncbi:TnsA-like heteromeric transposase endonuclease subunit [Streptomyces griseus]|uniref:TnsA-like heteromeric transposase endonuclease subunit n=1 Tax=Streptomyces griseus TaxID=1911 RepID=UPI00067A870B|nr:TnsA-like heteromeric transposase endonuclease subunit [Streptomyces griseus]
MLSQRARSPTGTGLERQRAGQLYEAARAGMGRDMRDVRAWHLDEWGELTVSTAVALAGVALEERQPPTDPVAYHGRQGKITAWPSSARSKVVCGSLRRLRVAVELDFDPEVVRFSGEPVELHWKSGRTRHRWRPDFVARMRDGSRCAVVMQPPRGIGPQWHERLAALKEVAQSAGWQVQIRSVPQGTQLENLMWLADYRFADRVDPEQEQAVLHAFRRRRPLFEGAGACGVPVLIAVDLVYALMWQRRLLFDWGQPLPRGPLVWTA